jgi:hypothetical protein
MTAQSTVQASAVSAVEAGIHGSAMAFVAGVGILGFVITVIAVIALTRAEAKDIPKVVTSLGPMVIGVLGARFRRQPPP